MAYGAVTMLVRTLAEYVRRVVSKDLREQRSRAVSRLFVLGDSQGSDVARHKDAYVADAIVSRHR